MQLDILGCPRKAAFIKKYYHAIPQAVLGAAIGCSPPYVRTIADALNLKRRQNLELSKSPTHTSWRAMRDRCDNPKNEKYHRYGGRGIGYCERWKKFVWFLEDMGPRPDGHTLDRIDFSRGYEPANCRWALPKTQAREKIKYENVLCVDCGERRPSRKFRCGRCNEYFRYNGKARPRSLNSHGFSLTPDCKAPS